MENQIKPFSIINLIQPSGFIFKCTCPAPQPLNSDAGSPTPTHATHHHTPGNKTPTHTHLMKQLRFNCLTISRTKHPGLPERKDVRRDVSRRKHIHVHTERNILEHMHRHGVPCIFHMKRKEIAA